MSGYEVERFLNPPKELIGYLCGVCQKVLYKPTQCKHCITYFCYDCIKRKLCPNNCQKGKEDSSLYKINKYMKNKINNTLKIKCKYAEFGCTKATLLKDIAAHEENCTAQAFFCPNKGCYQRIPAIKLDSHMKKCLYQIIPCSSCGFDIYRKDEGNHDCVSRMLEHIEKCNQRNKEISERVKDLKVQENELRNRLDFMTTENNNETMKLNQQAEHLEKQNGTIMHDISTIPVGDPTKTRQEELEELNEYDNVTHKSVNKYIRKIDTRINEHSDEISDAFEAMQERLRNHFKNFADNVRDKFEREVIHQGINQEFDKLSPIKGREESDEDLETGEDSKISGLNDSEEVNENDNCLSPELKQMKTSIVKAYANPLGEYHTLINTTAEFGKNNRLQNDIKYMSVRQRHEKSERTISAERQRSKSPTEMVKSARLWNAYDTYDPYPDKKYTTNVSSPSVPQTLTPNSRTTKLGFHKAKSASVYEDNKVRRKKDELVKTLLFSNRNRPS